MGLPAPQRLRDVGADSAALHELDAGPHVRFRHYAVRSRYFTRRFDDLDVGRRAERASDGAGISHRRSWRRRADAADRELRARSIDTGRLRVLAGWPLA